GAFRRGLRSRRLARQLKRVGIGARGGAPTRPHGPEISGADVANPVSAAITSAAARSPDSTAPSMYPVQRVAVSVPAQWIRPTGSRMAELYSRVAPGVAKPVGPPPLNSSRFQTIS